MIKSQSIQVQKIIDHLSDAVFLFDANYKLCFANSAVEDIMQVSVNHLMGLRASQFIQCPDEDVEVVFNRALYHSQVITEREMVLELAGHRVITVNCTITPLVETREILVELQQVDRQIRINREEQFIERNKTTREIIRGLAHEIKNPLGGIRGAAQLLERELPTASLREYTQVIIDESDRLSKLLNQLLGPIKIPKFEMINIHLVLERVSSIMRAEASHHIEIVRDFDPSIPTFSGDVDQLIQIFLNIAKNACQALNGKGKITLKSRVQRQQTIGNKRHKLVIKVDVIDNGPGIKTEIMDKIFYPMVTGRSDGTGLGLSIAQMLVSQHHGLIECKSSPTETIFSVLLPLGQKDG